MSMDIQQEKLQLISWVAQLNDERLIKRLLLLKEEQQKDWWDEITEEERSEIKEGMAEADRGEVIPHTKVMARYVKWRSK
ncbi:MAG: hypothetical protein ACOYXA_04980 [Bacteroidota bacterium]